MLAIIYHYLHYRVFLKFVFIDLPKAFDINNVFHLLEFSFSFAMYFIYISFVFHFYVLWMIPILFSVIQICNIHFQQ